MKLTELIFTYDYSPYRNQEDQEIPAYEIFNQEGDKVADTNENQPVSLSGGDCGTAGRLTPPIAGAGSGTVQRMGA